MQTSLNTTTNDDEITYFFTFIHLFLALSGGRLSLSLSRLGGSLLISGGSLGLSGGGGLDRGSLSLTSGTSLDWGSSLGVYFTFTSSNSLSDGGGSRGALVILLGMSSILLVLDFFFVLSSLLLSVLFEDLVVISNSLLGCLPSSLLAGSVNSLSSESGISDQSLDSGSLISDGLAFLFNLSSDNESSDVIILGQSEKFSDLGGSLGSESLGELGISESSDGLFTNLSDGEGNDGKIRADDASSDGLSLSFTSSSGSVALGASLHEESNSTLDMDTLLHGETILIISSGNFEGVSFEFVTKTVTVNFLTHSSSVEDGKLLVVINSDGLLAAG